MYTVVKGNFGRFLARNQGSLEVVSAASQVPIENLRLLAEGTPCNLTLMQLHRIALALECDISELVRR